MRPPFARIFLLIVLLAAAGPAAFGQIGMLHPPKVTAVTLYAPDVAWVEESRVVRLTPGRNSLRFDFTHGNVDLGSLAAAPADHPGEITLAAARRKSELPQSVFLEFESRYEGMETFRITYIIRGMSARTSYVLTYDETAGTLDLRQQTDVDNRTGEDYAGAAARVVFGAVNTAPGGPIFGRSAEAQGEGPAPQNEVLKVGFSEHELYTLPAPADYPDGEVRSIMSLHAPAVQAALRYDYSARRDGGRVFRIIEGKNTAEAGLTTATLPPGPWRLYVKDPSGAAAFVRSGQLESIPPGKEIKIEIGPDPEIAVERKLMDFRKVDLKFGEYNRQLVSYGTEEAVKVEFRNHKDRDVEITMLEPIDGTQNWEIAESSYPFTKKDANSIELKVTAPAGGKLEVFYRVKKRELTR